MLIFRLKAISRGEDSKSNDREGKPLMIYRRSWRFSSLFRIRIIYMRDNGVFMCSGRRGYETIVSFSPFLIIKVQISG